MSALRTYLGDAVYADLTSDGRVLLSVEEGATHHAIVLAPPLIERLINWHGPAVAQMRKWIGDAKDRASDVYRPTRREFEEEERQAERMHGGDEE